MAKQTFFTNREFHRDLSNLLKFTSTKPSTIVLVKDKQEVILNFDSWARLHGQFFKRLLKVCDKYQAVFYLADESLDGAFIIRIFNLPTNC